MDPFVIVREGRLVLPACTNCGCRLNTYDGKWWFHYDGSDIRDARGCVCEKYATIFRVIDRAVVAYENI